MWTKGLTTSQTESEMWFIFHFQIRESLRMILIAFLRDGSDLVSISSLVCKKLCSAVQRHRVAEAASGGFPCMLSPRLLTRLLSTLPSLREMSCECGMRDRPTSEFAGVKQIDALEKIQAA